jgi:hypothetical protein
MLVLTAFSSIMILYGIFSDTCEMAANERKWKNISSTSWLLIFVLTIREPFLSQLKLLFGKFSSNLKGVKFV